MKKTIEALVALGITCAADATDETVAGLVSGVVTGARTERDRFKTENENHVNARKDRVTTAVAQAVTDKIIPESRKAGMISIGAASNEGETEVISQIADLRAMSAQRTGRGAAPLPRGGGEGEETIQSLEDSLEEAVKADNAEVTNEIVMKLREKRGRKDLFAATPLIPFVQPRQN